MPSVGKNDKPIKQTDDIIQNENKSTIYDTAMIYDVEKGTNNQRQLKAESIGLIDIQIRRPMNCNDTRLGNM